MPAYLDHMAYASQGGLPWHGQGVRVEGEAMSASQVLELAIPAYAEGMEKRPLANLDGEVGKNPKFFGVYRRSDGALVGTCGRKFNVTQPIDALNVLDGLVEGGQVGYETAGTLREGSSLWLTAKVLEDPFEVVPGDLQELFLSVSTQFMSGASTHVMAHSARIVCANTEHLAIREGKKNKRHVSVSHLHKDQAAALKAATEALGYAHKAWQAYKEEALALVRKQLNPHALVGFVEHITPPHNKPDPETGEVDISPKLQKMRERLVELAVSGPGTTIPGVRGTAWGALQGFTRWLSHEGGTGGNTRLSNLWGGRYSTRANEARQFLLTMDPSQYAVPVVRGAALPAAQVVTGGNDSRFATLDL